MNSSDVTLRSLTYHDLSISDPYLENSLPPPMEIHNLHPPASLGQQGPAASGESSPPASIQLLPPPSTRGAGDRHRDSTRLWSHALSNKCYSRLGELWWMNVTSPKSFSDQFPPKLSGPMWSDQGVIQNNSNRHVEARHPKKLSNIWKRWSSFRGELVSGFRSEPAKWGPCHLRLPCNLRETSHATKTVLLGFHDVPCLFIFYFPSPFLWVHWQILAVISCNFCYIISSVDRNESKLNSGPSHDPSCRLRDNGGGDAHDGDQHVPWKATNATGDTGKLWERDQSGFVHGTCTTFTDILAKIIECIRTCWWTLGFWCTLDWNRPTVSIKHSPKPCQNKFSCASSSSGSRGIAWYLVPVLLAPSERNCICYPLTKSW